MTLRAIISGGQTGVDRGALDAALDASFPCGGWCPAGRLAEDGAIPSRYPLQVLEGGSYGDRTRKNVEDSDGTAILYFGELMGGTAQTLAWCLECQKPYKLIDAATLTPEGAAIAIAQFLARHAIATLNVAGPRHSHAPSAHRYAYACIARLLQLPGVLQLPAHLFAYGTLMCDDIMHAVSGCSLPAAPGLLTGYRRWAVKGQGYPAIAPDATGQVEGTIYRHVPPAAWERLDRFEGEMYTRQPVAIAQQDGETVVAATYAIGAAFLDRLDGYEWDFAEFLRYGKARFQQHYGGYQAL